MLLVSLYAFSFQECNRFWFAIKHFKLFKKILTSKQKQLSKIRLRSIVTCLPLVTQPNFHADGINSWLVIQNFSDVCRNDMYDMILELCNQRKNSELHKSCLFAKLKVALMENRAVLSPRHSILYSAIIGHGKYWQKVYLKEWWGNI